MPTKAELQDIINLAKQCEETIPDCFVPKGTSGFSEGDIFIIQNEDLALRGQKFRARVRDVQTTEPYAIRPGGK